NPTFTSASMDEVANVIKEVITNYRKSNALLVNAKRKLECLEATFDVIWRGPEVRQYFDKLDLSHLNASTKAIYSFVKEVLSNGHTQGLGNLYSEKRQLPEPENIRDKKSKRSIMSQSNSSTENYEESLNYEDSEELYHEDNDELLDEDREDLLGYEVQASEEEISTEEVMTDPATDWILSTEKNVGEVLSAYRAAIPLNKALIRQKVDFRISKYQFEMLIGLRSGGLPSAPKSRKWIDKVDLAVTLRDVLLNEGIENNGVAPN
ncbi:17813_t:CDS:2, partial [Racocetra fulgida]